MLTMFLCIACGFVLKKTNILPDNAGKVMAKLETWVFCPALSFSTMSLYFNVNTIATHATNIVFGCIAAFIALAIAIPLASCFVRSKANSEWGIYAYALAVANFGYMGDPIVMALFGDEMLAYYKLFTLPLSILIYVWGIGVLVPSGKSGGFFKKLLNAPTIAMFVGMLCGITGLTGYLPTFITGACTSLKACMGPVAMLLAGFTVARFDLFGMLKKKKVYVASALRLTVIPAVIVGILFAIRLLCNGPLGLEIGVIPLFLCFISVSMPLGLNTVVFPEAFGGNPETGASMTMISHTMCIITIPLMYALMVLIFGSPVI